MSKYLHMLVAWVTRAHNYIMTLNDSFETNFSDKELHFLVIGAIGLGLILLVYPLFRLLANHNKVLAITWIYVLTVLLVLTFAIEIGQFITGTGTMEFGEPVDPSDPECYDYDMKEEQRNGMLYTNVFWGNSLAYRWNHPGLFDADVVIGDCVMFGHEGMLGVVGIQYL